MVAQQLAAQVECCMVHVHSHLLTCDLPIRECLFWHTCGLLYALGRPEALFKRSPGEQTRV
jgi:hypothetical protein